MGLNAPLLLHALPCYIHSLSVFLQAGSVPCCWSPVFWAVTAWGRAGSGLRPSARQHTINMDTCSLSGHRTRRGHLSPISGEYVRRQLYVWAVRLREGAKT